MRSVPCLPGAASNREGGIYEGGPLYQNVQLECIGITNTADSLYAVKKAVYQEKRLTLAELVEILDNNF